MELPAHIKIGGAMWQIQHGEDTQERLREELNFGVTVEGKQVIRIANCSGYGNAPDKVAESLLHETIHAIEMAFFTPEDRSSEGYVKTFTAGLFQVLRDNPDVVAFILDKEEP